MFKSLFFVVAVALSIVTSVTFTLAENLSPDRYHVVDYLPSNRSILFRGNAPIQKKPDGHYECAYDLLYNTMKQKAASEANFTLPPADKVYMVEISLELIFESGQLALIEFWKKNPKKGRYMDWILAGDVIPSNWLSKSEQTEMILNGTVWLIDKLPERLVKLRRMLMDGPPPGYDTLAVLVHCSAGCDRTSEAIISYLIEYPGLYGFMPTMLEYYKRDCTLQYGCGRCPSFFSTAAASWYCQTFNLLNQSSSGRPKFNDCEPNQFSKCKLWSSHCVPAN